MPRESIAAKTARLKKIIAGFQKTYPEAHCELTYVRSAPIARCHDSFRAMHRQARQHCHAGFVQEIPFGGGFCGSAARRAGAAIKSTGFFRSKAKNIQNCCRKLVERHGGKVPRTMEELLQLDGVGRKTANVVLGDAFGVVVGVIVDTHAMRLSQRLGLTRETTPEKIERDLMKLLPRSHWLLFSHWLVWHGRRRCYARKPDCANCEIKKFCPQIGVEH